jgi:hypothetical protein
MPKVKLTLSVDKGTVEKAKKLGINISEITEKVLKGFAFSAKEAEASVVYASYKELFDLMRPLLLKYNAFVPIASQSGVQMEDGMIDYGQDVTEVLLGPDGTFCVPEGEIGFKEIEKIPLDQFYGISFILSSFIDALIKGSEKQKELLGQLEMAKRIIKALPEKPASQGVKRRTAKQPPRS